jgi:succinate dehydrogenase / fumarate reductase flavoprotein subunit
MRVWLMDTSLFLIQLAIILLQINLTKLDTEHIEFKKAEKAESEKINRILSIKGKKTPSQFHRELGKVMWDYCGMDATKLDLKKHWNLFLKSVKILAKPNCYGSAEDLNIVLEKALRVADFLEFAEILLWDALERRESCGAHFREEFQYPDGEAKRDDENFTHVAAWEFTGVGNKPNRHIEPLDLKM